MRREKTTVKTVIIMALAVLLPVVTQAGSLDPGGPPAPAMKTLDEIPPTWSQILPASERFVLVLGNTGVLDKETGLVWERSPSKTTHTWTKAQDHCYDLDKGGRKGWHLPTVEQLASLIDTSESNPALPDGNPFNNVQSALYWTATTHASEIPNAWFVSFNNSDVNDTAKTEHSFAWCVRGGEVLM
jgi:hypothetical protein